MVDQYKTSEELVDIVNHLTPEWNHFNLTLKDLSQDTLINETPQAYAHVTEIYELGNVHRKEDLTKGVSRTEIFGVYPVGIAWQPLEIKIQVDGHSYVKPDQRELWPHLFKFIQERTHQLLQQGYTLTELSGYKNQQDDWPGDIDAEEHIDYAAHLED